MEAMSPVRVEAEARAELSCRGTHHPQLPAELPGADTGPASRLASEPKRAVNILRVVLALRCAWFPG